MGVNTFIISLFIFLFCVSSGNCFQTAEASPDSLRYFSRNYTEARSRFLDAATAAGAVNKSFKNPHPGPEGEALYTDVALIGPENAENIIILGSGTLGVEGFAGSAIQTGLLSEGVVSGSMPKSRIIMVHAVNPYGFAHLRRWNEDNVDINRNFTDYSKPYPINPGYEKLAEAISPDSISLWSNIKSIFRLYRYRMTEGGAALKQAITAGQYTDANGLFYSGRKETWSNTIVRKIITRYVSQASQVVYIDFHTGLGEFGKAHIIIHQDKNSSAYKRAVGFWGDLVQTTHSKKADCANLKTNLKRAVYEMLPSADVTAVTLEFGTLSAFKVLWALRTENWLYHHGGLNHSDAEKIKTDLLRAFYPDDDDWRHQIWIQGKQAVRRVLHPSP